MQNQRKLKEQASRMGLTGGASEMASLGVVNNYASNYAANEGGRNAALNQNQMDYNNRVAANHESMANALANIYAQRASDESGFYNSAQKQAWDVANMKTQSDLETKAYKDKLAADRENTKLVADEVAKANRKAIARINKNKTKYVYVDANGYVRGTNSRSLAYQMGGMERGKSLTLADVNELYKTRKNYQYQNMYK